MKHRNNFKMLENKYENIIQTKNTENVSDNCKDM